jgi:hypothetical protein
MLESDSISLGKVFIKVLPMLARMRLRGDDATAVNNSTRWYYRSIVSPSGVIPEMPKALSGIIASADACCDPG